MVRLSRTLAIYSREQKGTQRHDLKDIDLLQLVSWTARVDIGAVGELSGLVSHTGRQWAIPKKRFPSRYEHKAPRDLMGIFEWL